MLASRFQVTNGSRKYKINKDLLSLKQNGLSLVEFYTSISALWEELEDMNALPVINEISEEVRLFLKALESQKQEARLFQFLNGLDEIYTPQRSQILMMTPLPTVEMACSVIQQEESQRENVKVDSSHEMAAMYTKTTSGNPHGTDRCSECGGKGHCKDNCW